MFRLIRRIVIKKTLNSFYRMHRIERRGIELKPYTQILSVLIMCTLATFAKSQNISSELKGNKALTLEVQKQLNLLEFDAGTEDGLWGRVTSRAVNSFLDQFGPSHADLTAAQLIESMKSVNDSWYGDPLTFNKPLIYPSVPLNSQKVFTSDIRETKFACDQCTGVVTMVLGAGDFDADSIDELIVGQHIIEVSDSERAIEQNTKLLILDFNSISGSVEELEFASGPHQLAGIHEREAVIADFNGDGIDDFFIADHGLDTQPFPGAQNMLVMSSPNGLQNVSTTHIPQITDMSHGAAGGDLDGDGDIDIVIATHESSNKYEPYVLINDGSGFFQKHDLAAFVKSPSIIQLSKGKDRFNAYSTFRLIDLNGDAAPELLLLRADINEVDSTSGSHILWNDGTGLFDGSVRTDLPTNRWGRNTFTNDADAIDLDGNGLVDLILTQSTRFGGWRGQFLQVLMQEEPHVFVDQTAKRIWNQGYKRDLNKIGFANETVLMDLNGDGNQDIVTRSLSAAMDEQGFESAILQVGINNGSGVFNPIDPRWLAVEPYAFRSPIPGKFGSSGEVAIVSYQQHGSYDPSIDETWGANFYLHTIPEDPSAYEDTGEAAKVLSLSWSTEIRDEGYKRTLEAEDVIFLDKRSNIKKIISTNVSIDGISGRDRLEYSVDDGQLSIQGVITVFGGERLFVRFNAELSAKKAVRTFGTQDRLILNWEMED